MDRDELAAWLRLLETPQVGRESARKLLTAFGSPHAVLAAPIAARREVVSAATATALAQAPDTVLALVDSTVQWLASAAPDAPRQVLTLGDPGYPTLLLETADPPLLLYLQGDSALLGTPSLAVVGSRNPTPQGKENARSFSSHLSQAGLTIVSGLALGIDGAAHEGALSGSGRTVAVIGTGLDSMYPRRHLELARRISSEALIISEYSLGTPPLPPNFPMRNRIIAGLTRGTLVVEAALQSGSLITARLASEAGRDVFAIPGSIHSPQSRGCHALIKQGAKLVDSAQDVLEELSWKVAGAPALEQPDPTAGENVDPLLVVMGFDPVNLDALIARTGWPAQLLNTRLLELELAGDVARLPGQLFQRVSTG
ncbi:MAG: DNA-protecting protein DprA [Cytophagales bacterium]|nr:DNA-protecting protein DprA [Rhizobacter sp.]